MAKKFFILNVFFLISAACVSARNIEVKSKEEVYQALPHLKAGDQLILDDGNYSDIRLIVTVSGTAASPVIIAAKNPGKVLFTGNVKVELRGDHLVLKGIYFTGGNRNPAEWKSHGPGLVAIFGSYNRVTDCAFNNFDLVHSAYITTSLDEKGKVPVHCRIDHCSFTNKLTLDQVINLNNTYKKGTAGGPPMYHRIDHCFFSNPKKKGNAGGGIRIGYFRNDTGRCLVDSNLFVRQDSEAEIITSKSMENVYYANTFLNCQGTLNFRHGDKQVAVNNFFIGTDNLYGYGGMFVWGSNHIIAQNYFNLSKTIASRGHAALYLNPGSRASEHALAFDMDIVNNLFVNNNGYAIHFNPMDEIRKKVNAAENTFFEVPGHIKIIGNVFYTDKKNNFAFFKDDYPHIERNLYWQKNIFYGATPGMQVAAGLKDQKPAIENYQGYFMVKNSTHLPNLRYNSIPGIDLNFKEMAAKGIMGKPFEISAFLSNWKQYTIGDYYLSGRLNEAMKENLEKIPVE
ncbi:chondroitinase-B domain-containing protein [Haoranjiania flava]|uniref:Uncharacterized protein n=1 Tax=Haoranjiania flava TaxID=1856322 RepID=A0AAE3IMJ6_9BACT|nr:chondroitinase-B domain-containing protein [Haoranjiania flava]MCU7694653.1 hypothetical protein [Haoranjiania flava]